MEHREVELSIPDRMSVTTPDGVTHTASYEVLEEADAPDARRTPLLERDGDDVQDGHQGGGTERPAS
jgi:hypothetical protein